MNVRSPYSKTAAGIILVFCAFWLACQLLNPPRENNRLDREVALSSLIDAPMAFLDTEVRENYPFHGLAFYYNSLAYFILSGDSLERLPESTSLKLQEGEELLVTGRFNVLAVNAPGLEIKLDEGMLGFVPYEGDTGTARLLGKNILADTDKRYDQLRYQHLWLPFNVLSRMAEAALSFIQQHLMSNWGMSIILFSILLKVLLLPVSIKTVQLQRHVSQIQTRLLPKLEEIKKHHDGEEAHNRLIQVHKDLGVTPFYALKPMLGALIQVPILIAIFNALGEMPQFREQPFLWIDNLAYPDALATLPVAIPLLGDKVSLLPILMTLLTLISTVSFDNSQAPPAETRKQKRNLYLMAVAFLVLFYPFPAAMVLFWTLANILQFVHQQLFRI